MKLLICVIHPFDLWRVPAWFAERVRTEFPQLTVVHLPDYQRLDEEIVDTDILINWNLRPQQFVAAKKLRWIHSTAAAVHALMFPELIHSDVIVTNASEVHGPVVAEHALALVLACAKRLPTAARYQAGHVWAQDQLWQEGVRPREIGGATLGILGFGAIGQPLARLAFALGMRVLALREHPGNVEASLRETGRLEILGPDDLPRLFSESDFLVLAAPVTPKTVNLVNPERLALMKPEAYLINVARGGLVDEPALVAALQQGRIAGAALDVAAHEPLPPDSPLWDLENVLLTPHTAALTEKLWQRNYDLFADNLRRFLAGRPLRAVVNKTRGY